MEKESIMGISDIVDKLKNNALFKISLGSKELFHSNFIESILSIESPEWRNFSKIFLEFFLDCELEEPFFLDSSREKNHIDIQLDLYDNPEKLLRTQKFTIVIENKVKSLPDKDQLEEYYKSYKSTNKDNDKFILLSLIEPKDFKEKDVKPWIFKTYRDLSSSLLLALKKTENTLPNRNGKISFKDLVEEYIGFITALSDLGQLIDTKKEDSYDFFEGEVSGVNLRKLRIHDLALKLKFQQIKSLLKQELVPPKITGFRICGQLTKKIHPEPNAIYLNTDFTNSKALVDATVCLGRIMRNGNDINLYHCLSVQLQGDQLRYCSYLHNTVSEKKDKLSVQTIKEIHSKLIPGLRKEWFDNTVLKSQFLKIGLEAVRKGDGRREDRTQTEPPGYCKFDNEFYFRYDIIAKYDVKEGQKVPRRGCDQTTIVEILNYFIILMTYINNNKSSIIQTLTLVDSNYSYLKCE